jgi:hypothetical protein
MTVDSSSPITILIHDGELADVRRLLEELGTTFVEREGGPEADDERTPWDLVIATAKRMLDFEVYESLPRPVRIAVLAGEARTVRRMLQREMVDFTVRRPVHPAALRLLILHALYRGPEKREDERATIGAPIRFRTGWRWRRAILVDLSVRGCRLLSTHRANRGERVALKLPAELTHQKPLFLKGRVVRRRHLVPDRLGTDAVAVTFGKLPHGAALRLRAVVHLYVSGPAALPPAIAKHHAGDPPSDPTRGPTALDRERGEDTGIADGGAEEVAAEPTGTERETRGIRGDRRSYSRRVIALGDEVARVLIGRDLSIGGMRVSPHPALAVGEELQIALHVRAGEPPLVVSAEVCRDDGARGLALQFRNLSAPAEQYLGAMVETLPRIEAPDEGDESESIVVSEILGREAR